MRGIGLSLPNRGVLFGAMGVGEMIDLAVRADEGGWFRSVWVGDGLVAKARLEAITSLSAIAARTERVHLGVCCLATFPLRQPVLLALQWASLDVLSDGRALLAVCLGSPTARSGGDFLAELEAMGVARSERISRFVENIQILRALWSGPAAYDGEYVTFPEIDLQPRPVQDPCPIWIASNPNPDVLSEDRYRRAIERVARHADGWQTTVVAPQDFGRRWDEVRSAADRLGRDGNAMISSVHLMINIDDDVSHARSEAKRFLDKYYSMDVSDEVMDRWGAYGPAEHVHERILKYVEQGLDAPILRFASFDQTTQFDRAEDHLLPELARQLSQRA